MFQKKQKPLHHRLPFIDPNPPKSHKKAILGIGLASIVAVAIAGVIEKGRDAQ